MVWTYSSVFMILISLRNSGMIAPVLQPCFRVRSYPHRDIIFITKSSTIKKKNVQKTKSLSVISIQGMLRHIININKTLIVMKKTYIFHSKLKELIKRFNVIHFLYP